MMMIGRTRTNFALALVLSIAAWGCGSEASKSSSNDGGSAGSGTAGSNQSGGSANGGGSSQSGGSANGGSLTSSGASNGGSALGGGGSTGSPPVLSVVPEVEDKCAGSAATDNCVWVTGHYGTSIVALDCSADALLAGAAWGCASDSINWNVAHALVDGSFEFDLDPRVDKQVTNFWLGDEARLTESSPSFAGTHCKVTYDRGALSGTCYGAWGANGDGTYESEVFASFWF